MGGWASILINMEFNEIDCCIDKNLFFQKHYVGKGVDELSICAQVFHTYDCLFKILGANIVLGMRWGWGGAVTTNDEKHGW